MRKVALALGLLTTTAFVYANDPLHGTTWRTIDDETKKPKAIVKFTENPTGVLSASIQQILTPGEENSCKSCEGKYKNVTLKGLKIVYNLKADGKGGYKGGKIYNPREDKTYSLAGKVGSDGKLHLRGYLGLKGLGLGRDQIWEPVK